MVTSESEAEAAAATWDPSAWGMASVPRSSKAMRNNDIDILAAMARSPQKLLSCVCSNLQPTGWHLNTGRGCFVLPCLLGIKKFNRRDCGMQGPSWNLWSWLILSRCKTPRSNLLRKVRNLSFCRLSQILLRATTRAVIIRDKASSNSYWRHTSSILKYKIESDRVF